MDITNKQHLIEPVINREPIGGFYCQSGLISEVVDSNYVTVDMDGIHPYTFHRDELLPISVHDKSLKPSEYSFKIIMTALKCGTLGGLE